MAATAPRRIKSAERTLALFELFSREQRPFTVGHIADSLKMPQPSVSMLLRNLRNLGYLEYDIRARTFTPSIRVALLGSWIDRRFSFVGSMSERVDRLFETLGMSCFIGIQNGAAAQYVLGRSTDEPDGLNVSSGQFRSLTCSAMGRALLSLLPDGEVLSWARRCNAEADDARYKVRESDFLALIQQVRGQGYGQTAGDVTPGLGAIAVAFASPMGRMPLAVGVGGSIGKMAAKRMEIVDALNVFVEGFERLGPIVEPTQAYAASAARAA
jgi:IclR family transcriptional regulator, KDG regulon repressor